MNDIKFRALMWAEMVDAGIVPLDASDLCRKSIVPALEGLTDDDKRRLKRKFRKLWRKLCGHHRYCMLTKGKPSGGQMRRRKAYVIHSFREKVRNDIKDAEARSGTLERS